MALSAIDDFWSPKGLSMTSNGFFLGLSKLFRKLTSIFKQGMTVENPEK